MTVSRVFLERCAAETGFAVPALEKVVRLGELAGDLGRHPVLGSALALKGGTALDLCFGTPTRLSVDLDLNALSATLDHPLMSYTRDHVLGQLTERAVREQLAPIEGPN